MSAPLITTEEPPGDEELILSYPIRGTKAPEQTGTKIRQRFSRHVFEGGCYQDSANACDSLADGYEAQGKPEPALECCRTACRLAEQASDRRLETFRRHLEAAQAKLGK